MAKKSSIEKNNRRARLAKRINPRREGVYRKFKLSRIAVRELASSGQIPGMLKSSW